MASSKDATPELAGKGPNGTSHIKRSAALRVKYRVFPQATAFHASLVAQNPQNRGGIAMNGSRCDELLRWVLGHFDEEEANHGAVAIEETPGVSTVRDYNRRKAVGDSALAEVGEAAIPYGSVGASHINQVLRNIIFKARSDLVPEALDSEGRLSLDRVALIDPAMAAACNVGLKWDILSHRIEIEEPTGIACIVAALNERASAQMMTHEMETIKILQRICAAEMQLSETVAVETVRARLHSQGHSALAESPGMPHLFRFVLEHGADTTVMEPLFSFHEKFVNPKLRRLREHHFKDVCGLNNAWLRLILLQGAYAIDRQKIRDTWIECFGQGAITAIMKPCMQAVRDEVARIVKTFHKKYAELSAYDHKPPGFQVKFLGRLGSTLGQELLAGGDATQVALSVRETTWKFEQELRHEMPEERQKSLGQPMCKPAEDAQPKTAPPAPESTKPKTAQVSFDEDGNTHEPALADRANEGLKVIQWTCMKEHADSRDDITKAKIFELLHVCSEAVSVVDSLGKVQVEGNPKKVDTCRVYLKEPALAGSLLFLPLIPHAMHITTASLHPHRVQVGTTHHGKPLCLSPTVRLDEGTALAGSPGKTWVVPFWVIRRVSDRKLANCTLAEITVDTIHTGGIGGEHLQVEHARIVFGSQLTLPVITNTTALEKDAELLLFTERQTKKASKAKSAPPRKRARLDDKAASSQSGTAKENKNEKDSASGPQQSSENR